MVSVKNMIDTISTAANRGANGPAPAGAKAAGQRGIAAPETVIKFANVCGIRARQRSVGDWFWAWKYAPLVP